MKRFTTIGFSANRDVWCHECLRAATGLSPEDPDYDSRPIIPLYAGDVTVHGECCGYCGKNLLARALRRDAEHEAERAARREEARRDAAIGPRVLRPVAPPIIRRRALASA